MIVHGKLFLIMRDRFEGVLPDRKGLRFPVGPIKLAKCHAYGHALVAIKGTIVRSFTLADRIHRPLFQLNERRIAEQID